MSENSPKPTPIEAVGKQVVGRYAELIAGSNNPLVEATFEAFMDLSGDAEPLSPERQAKINEIKKDNVKLGKSVLYIKKTFEGVDDADEFRTELSGGFEKVEKRVLEGEASSEEIEDLQNLLIAGFEKIAETEEIKLHGGRGGAARGQAADSEHNSSSTSSRPKVESPNTFKSDVDRATWVEGTYDSFKRYIDGRFKQKNITQEEAVTFFDDLAKIVKINDEFIDPKKSPLPDSVVILRDKLLFLATGGRSADADNQMNNKESLDRLAKLVEAKYGYDIRIQSHLTSWIRDQMKIILLENENRAVDIERSLRSSVGVFPVGIEQILEWLPENFAADLHMSVEDYIRRVKIEMGLQSKCQSRRQQLVEVMGSLEEEVKKLKSFSAAGDFLGMMAGDLEDQKDLLPIYLFDRDPKTGKVLQAKDAHGKTIPQKGDRIDGGYLNPKTREVIDPEYETSEVWRHALGRYEAMKFIWQDAVQLSVKVVENSPGNYTIKILKGAFSGKAVQANWDVFNKSLDSPNIGFGSWNFKDQQTIRDWFVENGYIPDGIQANVVFTPKPTDIKVSENDSPTTKTATWLVPGLDGRKALYALTHPDGPYKFGGKLKLYANRVEGGQVNWNRWGDMNFFYEGFGGSTPEQIEGVRRRIRAWVAGVNPDTLPDFNPLNEFSVKVWDRINQQSWLFERAANSYFYSTGGAAFLDCSGVGKTGLNLLLQTQRYLDGQKGTGRLGGSLIIRENLNRFIGTETDMLAVKRKLGQGFESGNIFNIYTGKAEAGGAKEPKFAIQLLRNDGVRYRQLDFLSGRRNPDKDFADSAFFMSMAFAIARGDQPLELSHLAEEFRWGGPPVINPKIEAPIVSLWKSLYLGVGIAGWNNSEIKMVKDVLHEDSHGDAFPTYDASVRAIRVPRLFHQLFVLSDAEEHYANWFGFSNAVNGQPISKSDEIVMEKVLVDTLKQQRVSWLTNGNSELILNDYVYYPSDVRNILHHASGKSTLQRNIERLMALRG